VSPRDDKGPIEDDGTLSDYYDQLRKRQDDARKERLEQLQREAENDLSRESRHDRP